MGSRTWLEDPALTPETEPVLAAHRERVTWDAPIHTVADVEGLPFPPRTLNVKPSRSGSIRGLFALYDYCAEQGIGLYGGGQFELGPGRGQIQYLASLFHPEARTTSPPAPTTSPSRRLGSRGAHSSPRRTRSASAGVADYIVSNV